MVWGAYLCVFLPWLPFPCLGLGMWDDFRPWLVCVASRRSLVCYDFACWGCGYLSEVRCKATAVIAIEAVVLQRSSMRSCIRWPTNALLVFLCPKPPTSKILLPTKRSPGLRLPVIPSPTCAYPLLDPTTAREVPLPMPCSCRGGRPTIAHAFTHYRGDGRKGI